MEELRDNVLTVFVSVCLCVSDLPQQNGGDQSGESEQPGQAVRPEVQILPEARTQDGRRGAGGSGAGRVLLHVIPRSHPPFCFYWTPLPHLCTWLGPPRPLSDSQYVFICFISRRLHIITCPSSVIGLAVNKCHLKINNKEMKRTMYTRAVYMKSNALRGEMMSTHADPHSHTHTET